MARKAVFLDRDGTMNEDPGYIFRSEDWRWLPEAVKGISVFNNAGWLVIVVSNQSGIARGFYSREDLGRLEAFVNADLAGRGARVDDWRYCPHLPEITGPCSCRKPEPGLLLAAARDLDIDLAASWMLGDRLIDVQAGLAAGARAGLVSANLQSAEAEKCRALYPDVPVWQNLCQSAFYIISGNQFQY
ncbi:MAG: HAD family hydrolase [Desulfovibrio sp.]|jgi:D-glycero-D-manno-heptose 1,7-bisphosphate phosphatase|nr:HAD family hydrolase [Desulfovibrio sp.]